MPVGLRLCVVFTSVLLASACAATCEDACNTLDECSTKLGVEPEQTVAECVTSCEADESCGDRQADFVECIADLECKSPLAAQAELLNCTSVCLENP